MKILVINGPNMNMLGIREPHIYGTKTYTDLCDYIEKICDDEKINVEIFQSNHEGNIIDCIQNAYNHTDGIIINAAAYTHTSIAIMDALKTVDIPAVEVHMSDINTREEFRHVSYISLACIQTFCGKGFESYKEAILYLLNNKL